MATGEGTDTINLAGSVSERTAEFKAGVKVDGGLDVDTVTKGINIVGTVMETNLP